MTINSLDVPWGTLPVTPHPQISGVDILPGYPSEQTAATSAALSAPWSGQTLEAHEHTPVESLHGMLLE